MMIISKREIYYIALAGIISIFIAVIIRIFFFQIFIIPSDSMLPTLKTGDNILVIKYPLKNINVSRNDIIVFKDEGSGQVFVKRIIGVEYDNVVIENTQLFVNGQKIENINYRFEYEENHNIIITEGHFFVLGDNSINSMDSRIFGAIKKDSVIGKVFFIFSPTDRMQLLL